jgi:ribulose 1,5-bisphosphate carboxylase large subunit-like protein
VGSDDYMLIVASWVDAHPDGLEAGARFFREAVDAEQA